MKKSFIYEHFVRWSIIVFGRKVFFVSEVSTKFDIALLARKKLTKVALSNCQFFVEAKVFCVSLQHAMILLFSGTNT